MYETKILNILTSNNETFTEVHYEQPPYTNKELTLQKKKCNKILFLEKKSGMAIYRLRRLKMCI